MFNKNYEESVSINDIYRRIYQMTLQLLNHQILQLPKILDYRGNLSFVEGLVHIPFKIQRAFWIYDVPGGETRGAHAYKTAQEFIIALSGSFDVILDNGIKKRKYSLNRSYYGLYVPAGTWRRMENFSTNALALVLSSTFYCERDYIRDYNDFLNFTAQINDLQIEHEDEVSQKQSSSNSLGNSVFDCSLIDLKINHRDKGNITVFENKKSLSFDVQRVYYLYDIPGGVLRGAHAHKKLRQVIIAASGSFNVLLDDGTNKKSITLNRPNNGLMIVPGIWEALSDFSSGAICLVLASDNFDEGDYLREYNEFINYKKHANETK